MVLIAALAVVLASAIVAVAIGRVPGNCFEPVVCVSDGHGCLPGPCGVERQRAVLLADATLITGLVVGAALLGVGLRPRR
jgi:hypothetical protein